MPKVTSKKIDPTGKVKTNRTKTQPAPSTLRPRTKKAPKAPSPSPSPEAEEEEDDDESGADENSEAESGGEGDTHLYGFSENEDDSDSSDDDNGVEEFAGIDVGKLPTIAKDDETVRRKLERAKKQPTVDRGVIYLGRIPHGFYEDEMRSYFSQFGDVTRLRLSRSKKSGRSKHYGFIEFDSSAVAQIVAETMDNYLLMGHLLTCKVIEKDNIHPALWIGANRKWRKVPMDRVIRVAHNRERNADEQRQVERRLLSRQKQKQAKLDKLGIKYDVSAAGYKKTTSKSIG